MESRYLESMAISLDPQQPVYMDQTDINNVRLEDDTSFYQRLGILGGTFMEETIAQGSFGIADPDIVPQWQEEKFPITTAAGKMAGGLAGMIGSLMVTNKILGLIPITSRLLQGARLYEAGGPALKFVGGTKAGALVGGTRAVLEETVRQVKTKDPSLVGLAQKATEEALIFGFTGGAGRAASESSRIIRGLAGGSSLATSEAMISLARGEKPDQFDLMQSFLLGFAFDSILSKNEKLSSQELLAAENRLKQIISFVDSGEKYTKKMFVDELEETLGRKVQKDILESLGEHLEQYSKKVNAPPKGVLDNVTKLSNKQKGALTSVIHSIPQLKKFGGAEAMKSKPRRKADKIVAKLLDDTIGVHDYDKMGIEQQKYVVNALKEFADLTNKGIMEFAGTVKAPGLIQKFAPPWLRTMFNLGMGDLVMPHYRARTKISLEMRQMTMITNQLDRAFLKAGTGRPKHDFRVLKLALDGDASAKASIAKNPIQQEVFDNYRKLYDYMLMWVNAANSWLGIKKIKHLDDYIRRAYVMTTKGDVREADPKMLSSGEKATRSKLTSRASELRPGEVIKDNASVSLYSTETVTGTAGGISPERTRKVDVTDLDRLLSRPSDLFLDMARNFYKRIYLEEPQRVLNRTLKHYKDAIPVEAQKFIADWTTHVALGYPTRTDRAADASLEKLFSKTRFDKLLRKTMAKMGKEMAPVTMKSVSQAYGRTLTRAYISARPDLAARNLTQRFLSLGLYDERAVMRSWFPISSKEDAFIKSHPFYTLSKGQGFEVDTTKLGKANKILSYNMTRSHISNVYNVMKTAYIQTKDYILNPKHWDKNWADPARKAGKLPEGGKIFFPSEEKKLNLEMWFGAWSTQYDYSSLGSSPMNTSQAGKMLFKFWSWPLNYHFNFWSEMLTRARTGSPGWAQGKKDVPKLGAWQRFGCLRHIAYTTAMIGAAKKAGWDLTSIGYGAQNIPFYSAIKDEAPVPSPLPDRGTHLLGLMFNVHKWATETDPYEKKKALNSIEYSVAPWNLYPGATAARKAYNVPEKGLKQVFLKPFPER